MVNPNWPTTVFEHMVKILNPFRALTRILKTGVPELSFPNHTKEYSLLEKIGVPAKKWEFRTANQQLVRALPLSRKKENIASSPLYRTTVFSKFRNSLV